LHRSRRCAENRESSEVILSIAMQPLNAKADPNGPIRPLAIDIIPRHHPDSRPNPITRRHPSLDLDLAISDALADLGIQPGRLNWVDDLAGGRV
jgi:hypothetical protein